MKKRTISGINPLILMNTKQFLKEHNVHISDEEMYAIINDALDIEFNHLPISFITYCDMSSNIPFASLDLFKKRISLNVEWLRRIILDKDNPIMKVAVKASIAHELSHKYNDVTYEYARCLNDIKFINWVNEFFADYYAFSIVTNRNCGIYELAIDYKTNNSNKDKNTFSHPSWRERKECFRTCKFDEKFIRQIAREVQCTNQLLVSKVCSHFGNIILE